LHVVDEGAVAEAPPPMTFGEGCENGNGRLRSAPGHVVDAEMIARELVDILPIPAITVLVRNLIEPTVRYLDDDERALGHLGQAKIAQSDGRLAQRLGEVIAAAVGIRVPDRGIGGAE